MPAAIKGESAFAAQGVIDGPQQRGARRQERGDQLGQIHGEYVDVPGGVTEEAMKATPMSVVEMAAGENDVGDVAMPMRENPARGDLAKGAKGRLRENRREML